MNIDEIVSTMLNGEIIHDGIVIGIVFICFYTLYNVMFSSVFTLFSRNR